MEHPSVRFRLVRQGLRLTLLACLAAILVAGAAPNLTPSGHAAGSGLVAAYSFDEGAGTSVADASGNGNTGTTANTTWSTGHAGSALSFNGTSSWVTVPDAPELDLTSGMTLEAWVKPSQLNGLWRSAILKETNGELSYGLYASTDTGPPSGHVLVGAAPDTYVRGASAPAVGAWTHVAATYDGSTLRVFVNGVQESSKSVSGPITTSTGALRIGGNAVWGEYFAGQIDDVRVYNRALGAAEVKSDMATPVAAPAAPTPSGLVAAYAFDAGSGTTAADASGQGNTGTIANATWTTAGHSGAALSFNGTNAMVSVADAPELDLTTAMTLEAWVKPTTTGAVWRTAVLKESGGDLAYGLYAASDSGPPSANVVVPGVAPTDTYVRGTSAPAVNTWTHVAATYNGSTLRIYVNGVQQASKAVTGSLATSTGALRIGGNAVWNEWFAGAIDDVRVYNRALSATEIQTDLGTAVGGGTAPPPPPPPSGDTTAPTAPTALTVTGKTQSTVSLSWTASTDNVGVAGYNVYNGQFDGSTTSTSFTVSGLACGTAYTLGVEAFDAAGNKSARSTVGATTSACPTSTANLFVSPTGNDANACTQAAPCRSFDRAYRVARPGDTVQMAGGTYPGQTIGVDTSKVAATSDVTFVPAAGATVTINGDLDVYGSHVYFKGGANPSTIRLHNLGVQGTAGTNTAQYDTFENLDGAAFEIGPTHHITIKGGDWGPNYVCGGGGTAENKVGPDGGIMNQWPHDIVLDGLTIHDQNSQDLNNCHMGGLFLVSGGPITIRNSVFQQNVVYQIQIQDFTTPQCCGMHFGAVHDLTIENNWFGPPVTGLADPGGDRTNDNQDELQFDTRQAGECWTNILIRFNSFHNGPNLSFDNPSCFSNVRVVGNIGQAPSCWSGVTWAYNAWVGGKCGTTDVSIGSLPYASTTIGSEDYHLTGGAAVDLVTPTTGDYALGTDIDGQARPRGAARDAGADER
jgi:hypothetical protein